MRIGIFEFRPRLIPTLVTLLSLPVLISLGFWQLERAQEKRGILAEQERLASLPPISLNEQSSVDVSDIVYRKVKVAGRFDTRYRIYIDNKVQQGKVGYQIVEPIVLDEDGNAILVNRGWVAMTGSRSELPAVADLPGEQTLVGMVKLDPRDVANFGAGNRSGENWPALVRWIDINELQQSMPYKLMPFLFLQTNESQDGLVRDWVFVSLPPEKNQSYALQWFSLALALFLIYVVVNTKRIKQ